MTTVGLPGISGRGLGLGLQWMTSVSPSEGTTLKQSSIGEKTRHQLSNHSWA